MSTNPLRTSDENLRQAIFQALAEDAQTAGLLFRVGVLHGVAHLAGEVPTRTLWDRAAEIAAGVLGVRGVVNRISAPGAPSPTRSIQINLEGGYEL